MRNHRTKDRKKILRCGAVAGVSGGVASGVSGFSLTLQNNRLGWIDIAPDWSCEQMPYYHLKSSVTALISQVTAPPENGPRSSSPSISARLHVIR